jgi:hypothetical protein
MKTYLEKNHRIFGYIGALLATVVAVIYLLLIPEEAAGSSGVQKTILLYAHSVCWILLSGSSIAWAIKKKNKWSGPFAYAALATYVVFINTLLFTKYT